MRLDDLRRAREQSPLRISWGAIFLKAYAIVAEPIPVLRQTWMSWPWPHLYEHPEQVATIAVQRQFQGNDWLFWGRLFHCSRISLHKIQQQLDQFQHGPVEKVFDRQLWLARQWQWVRRFFWLHTFHVGEHRCQRLGTHFLTSIAGAGAEIDHPPSMLTSGLTYGPLDHQGNCRVTVVYDHRLLDGWRVAQILAQLEQILQHEIRHELQSLSELPGMAGTGMAIGR